MATGLLKGMKLSHDNGIEVKPSTSRKTESHTRYELNNSSVYDENFEFTVSKFKFICPGNITSLYFLAVCFRPKCSLEFVHRCEHQATG